MTKDKPTLTKTGYRYCKVCDTYTDHTMVFTVSSTGRRRTLLSRICPSCGEEKANQPRKRKKQKKD